MWPVAASNGRFRTVSAQLTRFQPLRTIDPLVTETTTCKNVRPTAAALRNAFSVAWGQRLALFSSCSKKAVGVRSHRPVSLAPSFSQPSGVQPRAML